MEIDKNQVLQAFKRYVGAYDIADPKIALKISHTYRVAALAEKIAASLPEATEELVALSWMLGMLHDIGRFEQIRRYHTFSDAASVSHAALGAQILFESDEPHSNAGTSAKVAARDSRGPLIRQFVEDPVADAIIRRAIELHSAWHLPEDLTPHESTLCIILRDADKIDILKVNCIQPVEDIYGISQQELLKSPLSDEAAGWFWRHSTMPRDARHFPADTLLSHVCFVWELSYPKSFELAWHDGSVFAMMERPWELTSTQHAFAEMEDTLKEWLASRLH
ncbi:MAG: HD domain-containing protein [Atopobiaceae bacterium]